MHLGRGDQSQSFDMLPATGRRTRGSSWRVGVLVSGVKVEEEKIVVKQTFNPGAKVPRSLLPSGLRLRHDDEDDT